MGVGPAVPALLMRMSMVGPKAARHAATMWLGESSAATSAWMARASVPLLRARTASMKVVARAALLGETYVMATYSQGEWLNIWEPFDGQLAYFLPLRLFWRVPEPLQHRRHACLRSRWLLYRQVIAGRSCLNKSNGKRPVGVQSTEVADWCRSSYIYSLLTLKVFTASGNRCSESKDKAGGNISLPVSSI